MMTATRKNLTDWFDIGTKIDAVYMIVVRSTETHTTTAVYVMRGEDVHECVRRERSRRLQQVTEVYNLHSDEMSQIIRGEK